MATRARIGVQLADDSILSVYHHYDGYPEWLGKQLEETKLGAGQPAASTGKDLVFNIETGEVKKEQPKLEGIAEGDEEGDI